MAVPNCCDWAGHVFDLASTFQQPEALRGMRVIDLGSIVLTPRTAEPPAHSPARNPR